MGGREAFGGPWRGLGAPKHGAGAADLVAVGPVEAIEAPALLDVGHGGGGFVFVVSTAGAFASAGVTVFSATFLWLRGTRFCRPRPIA
jgi:hypothetical protein